MKMAIFVFLLAQITASAAPAWSKAFVATIEIVTLQSAIRVRIPISEEIPRDYYTYPENEKDDPLLVSDNVIPSIEATVMAKKCDISLTQEQIKGITLQLKEKWKAEKPNAGMGVSPTIYIIIPDTSDEFLWLLEFTPVGSPGRGFVVNMSLARSCGSGCYQWMAHSKNTDLRSSPILDALGTGALAKLASVTNARQRH